MRRITLTAEQMEEVREVSDRLHDRYDAGIVARSRYEVGSADQRRERRFTAMCAEYAVALETRQPWGRGNPRKADVGVHDEVRWTGAYRDPELRFYDPDGERSQDRGHEGREFWLVTGRPPTMIIHGHLSGRECMRLGSRRRNREGSWSYYVPAQELPPYPPSALVGTPIGPPRPCPACRLEHPVGTTCAGGWAPA